MEFLGKFHTFNVSFASLCIWMNPAFIPLIFNPLSQHTYLMLLLRNQLYSSQHHSLHPLCCYFSSLWARTHWNMDNRDAQARCCVFISSNVTDIEVKTLLRIMFSHCLVPILLCDLPIKHLWFPAPHLLPNLSSYIPPSSWVFLEPDFPLLLNA